MAEPEGGSMPFMAHLAELRKRIMISAIATGICMVLAYVFYDPLYRFLTKPFSVLPSRGEERLFITSVMEGFMVRFKVSLYAGAVLSTPVHVWNALRFIFPGLKETEKKVVGWTLGISAILLIGSGWYTYSVVLPLSVGYLTGSDFLPKGVGLMLHYGENIQYVFLFIFFGMLIFQLPIVLALLLKFNLLKRKPLWGMGRYIIVGIFIFAAIVTPPDWVSQCSLAIPMIVFFYLTLVLAKIFRWGES